MKNEIEKLLSSTPPAWLPDHAKEVFTSTVKELAAAGRPLREIHLQTVIGLAQAADMARQAGDAISRDGFSTDGGREGQKRHPAISAQIAALASVRAYAVQLGMTPASASRLPPVTATRQSKFKILAR
jgi:P27 family predicted phage terminase small subunit